MGLLKHAILPFYTVRNLIISYRSLILENIGDDTLKKWSSSSPGTPLEQHFTHFVGGASAALLVNAVVAIFMENSHYRGMAVVLQLLCFGVDGYSYYTLGVSPHPVIYAVVGSGVVGLIVHSMEPGIFTKDKAQKWKAR